MWKDTTYRKVLPVPKSSGWRRMLYLGIAAFPLIAVIAGVAGFRDGSPGDSGVARFVCIIAALCFVGLAGVGLAVRRRSG
jgi:hypothetical protein